MPNIGNTPRPAYVYDLETDTWVPVGTGPHTHVASEITDLQSAIDTKLNASRYLIGPTSARPVGTQGDLYYDTTLDNLYQKTSSSWAKAGTVGAISASILVVAGGGGGGGQVGGGGGGGGLQQFSAISLESGSTQSISIGAGGAPAAFGNANGTVTNRGSNGTASVFGSLAASVGGGGGGGYSGWAGLSGGSGGGSDGAGGGVGLGTAGQGNSGGNGFAGSWAGGGGGGAGAVGGNASASIGGDGGVGKTSALINAMGAATSSGQLSSGSYYFAGGGGGCNSNNSTGRIGYGGLGGGANAANDTQGTVAGTINTGGGGGGARDQNPSTSGGSGIVIVQYPATANDFTAIDAGLTFTKYVTGGFKYYKFTAGTGTITI